MLKTGYHETWPCYHVAIDGFFEDDYHQRLVDRSGPEDDQIRLHRLFADGQMEKILSKISDIPKLAHARSPLSHDLTPHPTNFCGRHGIYWKRLAVACMMQADVPEGLPERDYEEAAGLEIWKNQQRTKLMHRIPWKNNRAVIIEIRPDLFYTFTPPCEIEVFWEEYWTMDAPEWITMAMQSMQLERQTLLKRMSDET